MEQVKCDYCGKIKADNSFYIGASKDPDWVLVEGTGKMTCPSCHKKAVKEGQDAINKHIEAMNNKFINDHIIIAGIKK